MSWWHWFLRHFLEETGSASSSSRAYNFWSGFAGDLPMLGIFGVLYRKHNCHQPGCWRIGKHTNGDLVVCRLHHPRFAR